MAVKVCIFTGPTLPAKEGAAILDAVYLPPAAYGDVYRATLRRPQPRAIGLIDGCFRLAPAVRHREILWAMAQGIHVFGAASIGALRAADLADFGMIGVGEIFEEYRAGSIEDDDELAVDHGPCELGYVATNDAMVDIRATLAAALRAGVIGADLHERIVVTAKALHYAHRRLASVLDRVADAGGDQAELEVLRAWLPGGRIGLKRRDALAMLAAIRDFIASDPPPLRVAWPFERTETWESDMALAAPAGHGDGGELLREDLLDELRLDPAAWRAVRREALARALALREAERQRLELPEGGPATAELRLLDEDGIPTGRGREAWCAANCLDADGYRAFVEAELRCRRLAEMAEPLVERHMLDAMRASGRYAALAARAADKRRILAQAGRLEGTLADSGLSGLDLLAWYAERTPGQPLPDADAIAARLGFADASSLYRALLREYHYALSRSDGQP